MKKTYIKPENTVVALNVCDNVMITISGGDGEGRIVDEGDNGGNTSGNGGSDIIVDAREVIRSRGAWEEW